MQEFIDKIEDFLEKGAELNNFSYLVSDNKKVHQFSIGREVLVLVNHATCETAILNNNEIGKIPNGFIRHVINTLQPTLIGGK